MSHECEAVVGSGPLEMYDWIGFYQAKVLFDLGLRAYHKLLDFGCGTLRGGRFLIQYLNKGNYYGIDRNKSFYRKGVAGNHLRQLIEEKHPHFRFSSDCNMYAFRTKFDYILAYSVFTHMPKSQIIESLGSAYKAMKRTSIFVATYFEGTADNGLERYTKAAVYYRTESILKMIQESGLTAEELDIDLPYGQKFLLIKRRLL